MRPSSSFPSIQQGERLTMGLREVADALGVSVTHIWRLANAGVIPTVTIGKRKLVLREEFEAFLRGERQWEVRP